MILLKFSSKVIYTSFAFVQFPTSSRLRANVSPPRENHCNMPHSPVNPYPTPFTRLRPPSPASIVLALVITTKNGALLLGFVKLRSPKNEIVTFSCTIRHRNETCTAVFVKSAKHVVDLDLSFAHHSISLTAAPEGRRTLPSHRKPEGIPSKKSRQNIITGARRCFK